MSRQTLDESVTIIVRGLVLAGLTWLIITTADVRERVKVLEWRMTAMEAR